MTEDEILEIPVLLSHNDYILRQTEEIRKKIIPWEGYMKASLIDLKELELIKEYSNSTRAENQQDNPGKVFVGLLAKLSRVDTIQSILVLIDDKGFKVQGGGEKILLKLLQKEDEYIQLKAAKILIQELQTRPTGNVIKKTDGFSEGLTQTECVELLRWLVLQISSTKIDIVDIGLQLLLALLSVLEFRDLYFDVDGGVEAMINLLRGKDFQNAQIQYQVIYSMWLLSFTNRSGALESRYHITGLLMDISKSAIKEKVVRVIMATFKNMIQISPNETIIPMLGLKLLSVIEVLSVRKWSDPEIIEDMMVLRDALGQHLASLSTWDEYKTEIESARLEWSPPHLSEQFWKTNGSRMSDHSNALVKCGITDNRILVNLMKESKNEVVLAVACNDIGQFVKFGGHSAKKIVDDCDAKVAVMELMSHENADVRYQALTAVQKIMMNSF